MNPKKFEEKININLTNHLNLLVPEFISTAHEYFKESFLDNFKWNENSDKIKFLVKYDDSKANISHEGNLVLGANKYFRGNYDVSNFNEEQITGFGIINFFHEITHCYLKHKKFFQNKNLLLLPRLENSLIESFCDLSAHRISKKYPEASEAIKLEEKIYSVLVNRAKYGDHYFRELTDNYAVNDNFLLSKEKDKELEIAANEAELFNNTSKAIAYSKFENYSSLKEMLSLFDKFRNFNELRYFIPDIT